MSSNIRNKTKMSTLTTFIQHSFGSQRRKRNKRNPNWKKGLKSLLQHYSSKASVLRCSAFLMVQLSHPYMTTGKTRVLTRWTLCTLSKLSRFPWCMLIARNGKDHILVSKQYCMKCCYRNYLTSMECVLT